MANHFIHEGDLINYKGTLYIGDYNYPVRVESIKNINEGDELEFPHGDVYVAENTELELMIEN